MTNPFRATGAAPNLPHTQRPEFTIKSGESEFRGRAANMPYIKHLVFTKWFPQLAKSLVEVLRNEVIDEMQKSLDEANERITALETNMNVLGETAKALRAKREGDIQ